MKLKELEEGKVVLSGDMTLNEWAEQCIATYKTGVADITLKKYNSRVNCCILKYIGDKKLKTIKPLQLQQVLIDFIEKISHTPNLKKVIKKGK